MESNKEITEELKEYIINLLNCTDDPNMKATLKLILNGDIIERCKCPMCGEKFDPRENMKLSTKILQSN